MWLYLLAGLLGMIFQQLAKMQSLKDLFEAANEPFTISKFLEREAISIAMSTIAILILAVTINEVLYKIPMLENYKRLAFTLTGAIGSWILSQLLGKSKRYITKIIDDKTNIADSQPQND